MLQIVTRRRGVSPGNMRGRLPMLLEHPARRSFGIRLSSKILEASPSHPRNDFFERKLLPRSTHTFERRGSKEEIRPQTGSSNMLHSKESTANAQTDNVLLDNDVADAYDFKETTLKRRIVTNEVSVGNDCANNNNTDCENAHRGTFPPLIASIYNDRTYYLHTDKSPNTSFYLGHDFELRCRHMLQSHGFHMEHRGRSGDAGIDLAGEWTMPLKPVRVIGQCKRVRRASRMSVAIVREWEGVVAGMNVGKLKNDKEVMMATGDEHDKPCIGLLLATANLSPAAVDRLLSSVQPMIFVWVHADAPLMLAFLMNESARKIVPDIATAVDPHASATAHFDQATEGMAAMNGRKRKTGMTAVRPARVDHVR